MFRPLGFPVDFTEMGIVPEHRTAGEVELGVGRARHAGVRPRHPPVGLFSRVVKGGALGEKAVVFPERELTGPLHAEAKFAFTKTNKCPTLLGAVLAVHFFQE